MEIRLLGPVEVVVDGAVVGVGSPRQRHVLAVLVAEPGRPVRPEVVARRVWGEGVGRVPPSLHTYISQLRRVLGPVGVVIAREGGGYVCGVEASAVDAHRFADLVARARAADDAERAVGLWEQALGLWRGEPVAGLDTPWAVRWRARLGDERAAAESDHVDVLLRVGRHGQALPVLAARVRERPWDERVAGQYLTALYRSGRQAEALAHYDLVRRRLVEELGTDPGPDLRELHHRILTADPGLAAPPDPTTRPDPTTAAPRSPAPVPRQLPPAPPYFVGRATELANLTDTLTEATRHGGTVVISALAGAGGIGKTWLALHWAHHNLHRFPDGQLFIDLRGFSPDSLPVDPTVAVRGFLDALDVDPGRIPADPQAQTALYRSLLADKRMLVVLDNAATSDQIAPLLPGGASCTVVVTSRRRLTTLISRHGAHHLHLDPLTDHEAHALLVQRLGTHRVDAEPHAVTDLLTYCRGFPLALSLIAGRAQAEPHLPLTQIVTELREPGLAALDDDEPTGSLPTVLSWSHHALTPAQQHAFALLAIAPGPDIALPAAASLIGQPPTHTRRLLRTLTDASLLDHDPHDRYTMHDLIRAYATTTSHHLDPTERDHALRRVLDFYTHTADTADDVLRPFRTPIPLDPPVPGVQPHPVPDTAAALAWFAAEHPHLLAAQRTAAAHDWHPTVWHLAWTTSGYHVGRGHRHDELAVWQTALDSAPHLPDATNRILYAHRNLGRAHARLGRYDHAIDHLHRALRLTEEHHDITQQAHTHQAIALIWEHQQDFRQALHHSTRALELFRTVDEPVWHANALNSVGWFAARLGDHDTARDHCRQALTLLRRHHFPEAEANVLDSLGYIDHHTGHHHQAVEHYQQALALYRDLGSTDLAADMLDHLGHPHTALGQHHQARTAWTEALTLYRQQGRHDDAARVQRQLDALDRPTPTDTDPGTGADTGTDTGTGS
ncbi:AfsR/SARP family transcriptional regulator [Saccharothrix australiensis]|uniref:DNA-binding SARP family transcriptional activator n=1 Tax=Saccharothrix australiensis TaxID=2072 RepID=A0A495W7G3_9PSEU|nr:BTAD domain-containing putative transcriptional regulator [Saccharothrix australiensis]RKT55728.1 DNA-binding SARP family transcriptional activator [Saccharothrix australiensis]